ncbi:hypothetical protein V1477_007579 [Vespula maculifrons]|uniref:Uncharacterized protein n=1 Tax=Vespula maculifrons TaxID=7453 RepID=A0ABD2CIZ0_VESMC
MLISSVGIPYPVYRDQVVFQWCLRWQEMISVGCTGEAVCILFDTIPCITERIRNKNDSTISEPEFDLT